MLKIDIIAVGRMGQGALSDLYSDYERRLGWKVSLFEIDLKSKQSSILKDQEAKAIAERLDPRAYKIMMDERGKSIKSIEFSSLIQNQMIQGQSKIQCILGGADGLSEDIRKKGDFLLSFGKQTWPHMLARVMLIEQLYRAEQITHGHPYHRE